MEEERPLRCVLIGCGRRARDYYGRLLQLLPEVELVACASRSLSSAAAFAAPRGLPAFDDLDRLVRELEFDFAVLAVPYADNGRMGLELVQRGISYLAETPLAHDLAEGDSIVREAAERGLVVGVAENYPRDPHEQLKHCLVESGVFGKVLHVASEFAGHGYHGTALLRHLVGPQARPLRALGLRREFGVAPHFPLYGGERRTRELWEFGALEFEGGAFGSFLFSDHGYDSPLRWHRQTRFYAERGMGVDRELALLSEDGRRRHPLAIRRETHALGDVQALVALRAELPPWARPADGADAVEWRNPCADLPLHDDALAVALCILDLVQALRGDRPPAYDAAQGLLDQECVLAMGRSHERGGEPCPLPLPR